MELVFATHNLHKLNEVRAIVGTHFSIIGLSDINFLEDIPETGNTLIENALQKAQLIHNKFNCNCFADDTGLEIDALNNRPGVYSARYAGEHCSFEDNMNKVLLEMSGFENRNACFKTVIALILNNKQYLFEGKIEGTITKEPRGLKGFGYDPIFLPNNYSQTFAELSAIEKNKISHRAISTHKLTDFLLTL